MRPVDIAIVGGGPVGLEAALYARAAGRSFRVFEAGPGAAASVARWGFARMLTPWRLSTSPLGLAVLRERGDELPDPDAFPTGTELVERYLEPIARSLGADFRPATRVLGVGRRGVLKQENVGGRRRASAPFRLVVESAGSTRSETALTVFDASGVYTTPCGLGDGGLDVPGERALTGRIHRHLTDIDGSRRATFAGRTTLVVGAGFSAADSLARLLRVRESSPSTEIVWARRQSGPAPLPVFDDDPLPERAELGALANRIAAVPRPGLTALAGVAVERCREVDGRIAVTFCPVDGGGAPREIAVDEIVACVGFRPDLEPTRELQIEHCPATEGPAALAAALRERSGSTGGGDLLAPHDVAPEHQITTEPGLFVLGQKSYGRRSDFLIRAGHDQIRDVFRAIANDPELDLYGDANSPP